MHGVLVPIDKVLPVTMNKNPSFPDNVSVTVSPEKSRRHLKHPTRTLQSTDTSLIVSSKSTTSDVIDPPPTSTSIKTTIAKPDSASIPVIFQTPKMPFMDITRPPLIEQTAPPLQSADATSLTVSSKSTSATVIDQNSTKTSTNTTNLTVSPESARPYVVDQTTNTTSLTASSKNTGLAVIDQISTITSTNITSLTLSLESTRSSLIEQTSTLQSTDITSLTVSTESTRPPLIDQASTIQSTDITSLTVPHDRTRSTVADQTSTLQSKDTTSMTGSPENTRPNVKFETICLTGSPERIGPPDTGNSQHGLHKYYERIVSNLELDMCVLDFLISLCVMTTEDKDEINKEPTKSDRNRIILDILIARPYQTCHLFKEALHNGDPNSSELVAEMDFTAEYTDEQDESLPQILAGEQPVADHKIRLQKNYKKIVEEINVIGHICDSLVSKCVISLDDQQEVNAGINTSECNRRLLSKLIHGSLSSYTSFIEILRGDNIYKDLACDIEQTPISEHDIQRLKIGMRQLEDRQNNRILVMRNKGLVERLRKMELLMAETIPENRRELISICLEEWRKENIIFVTTSAAERVCKLIRENNCVTVTGNSGVGKTAAVRNAALMLIHEGYMVIPINTPEAILQFYNCKRKTLFVIDDLCGKYTLNQQYLNDWKLKLNDIKLLLQKGHCKIIATCRLQVFKDERFKYLSIFKSYECNLNSKELCLSSHEKLKLVNAYCGKNAIDVSDSDATCDFLPLLCSLYQKNTSTEFSTFFSNPFQFYDNEIECLLLEDEVGKYKYCCLVLIVIFNNELNQDSISMIDSKVQKIIEDTLCACELNKGTSPKGLFKSLKTLEGTFLVNVEGSYKTIHDKLFDYLSHYFGNKMLNLLIDHADYKFISERFIWITSDQTTATDFTINIPDDCVDAYIKRMITDWSDGKVVDVFSNRNMESHKFKAKLQEHLNHLDLCRQSRLALIRVDSEYDYTTLIQSCFVGDFNFTKWILNNGVSVNQCGNDGTSPLYIACQEGFIDTIRELIKCGADINKCVDEGASPLFIAFQNGHIDTVRELIKCGADLNKCRGIGFSPLYVACQEGFIDTIRELIKCGADINKCNDEGTSPLHTACEEGFIDIVKELIKCGADINKCDNTDVSPLYIACQYGHLDIVRALVQSKVDTNKCMHVGESPLFIAVLINSKDIVKVLLDNNSNVNTCANNKEKYCEAIVKYHTETIEKYMERTRDFIFKYTSPNVKHYIQERLGNQVMDLVAGSSPLHIACFMGHSDIIQLILEKNPDINIPKEDGTTPLFLACEFGHLNIVKLMIEIGADDELCRTDGKSPSSIASEH